MTSQPEKDDLVKQFDTEKIFHQVVAKSKKKRVRQLWLRSAVILMAILSMGCYFSTELTETINHYFGKGAGSLIKTTKSDKSAKLTVTAAFESEGIYYFILHSPSKKTIELSRTAFKGALTAQNITPADGRDGQYLLLTGSSSLVDETTTKSLTIDTLMAGRKEINGEIRLKATEILRDPLVEELDQAQVFNQLNSDERPFLALKTTKETKMNLPIAPGVRVVQTGFVGDKLHLQVEMDHYAEQNLLEIQSQNTSAELIQQFVFSKKSYQPIAYEKTYIEFVFSGLPGEKKALTLDCTGQVYTEYLAGPGEMSVNKIQELPTRSFVDPTTGLKVVLTPINVTIIPTSTQSEPLKLTAITKHSQKEKTLIDIESAELVPASENQFFMTFLDLDNIVSLRSNAVSLKEIADTAQ